MPTLAHILARALAHAPSPGRLAAYAGTLAIAALGGYGAHLLRVPLAWMIGAMLAVAAAGLTRLKPAAPVLFRPTALIILGTSFGQAFTAPVLAALAESLPALTFAGAASVLTAALASRITARIGGLDTKTAFFVSVPGGIVAMVVLAARAGASIPAVTLAQTLRMMMVVLAYPVAVAALGQPGEDAFSFTPPPVVWPLLPLLLAATVAGAFLLDRLDMANPWMMGPVFVSLLLAVIGAPLSGLPGWLIDAAQVAMGAALGTRMTREFLFRSHRLLVASVVNMALLSVLSVLIALACVLLGGLPLPTTLLGTAPGGMPEMAITAKVLNLGVPLVLGFHLVRLLICNVFVAPLYRGYAWAERRLGLSSGE